MLTEKEIRAKTQEIIDRNGLPEACRILKMRPESLLRVAAGVKVRAGTLAQAGAGLEAAALPAGYVTARQWLLDKPDADDTDEDYTAYSIACQDGPLLTRLQYGKLVAELG